MKTVFCLFVVFLSLTNLFADWKPGDPIIDERDGQSYKTVKIGNQVWMAENLNIGTIIPSVKGGQLMSNNGIIEKYCWGDSTDNCNGNDGLMKRGGFYEWEEAVQYWNGQPKLPVQGICPKGWHIPSNSEWNTLLNYLGGTQAFKKMIDGGGSGFDGLMTGYRCTMTGGFRVSAMSSDTRTYFWSAEQTDNENAPFVELGTNSLTAIAFYKSVGLCIRCIMDESTNQSKALIQSNNTEINFGDVSLDALKKEELTIMNSGNADLIISKVFLKNSLNGCFLISESNLPITVTPNQTVKITVIFKPKEAADYTTTLSIESNASNTPVMELKVSGRGVDLTDIKDLAALDVPKIQLMPNPAAELCNLEIKLPSAINGLMKVYLTDINGEIVKEIDSIFLNGTEFNYKISSENLAIGLYFVICEINNKTYKQPLIILK